MGAFYRFLLAHHAPRFQSLDGDVVEESQFVWDNIVHPMETKGGRFYYLGELQDQVDHKTIACISKALRDKDYIAKECQAGSGDATKKIPSADSSVDGTKTRKPVGPISSPAAGSFNTMKQVVGVAASKTNMAETTPSDTGSRGELEKDSNNASKESSMKRSTAKDRTETDKAAARKSTRLASATTEAPASTRTLAAPRLTRSNSHVTAALTTRPKRRASVPSVTPEQSSAPKVAKKETAPKPLL